MAKLRHRAAQPPSSLHTIKATNTVLSDGLYIRALLCWHALEEISKSSKNIPEETKIWSIQYWLPAPSFELTHSHTFFKRFHVMNFRFSHFSFEYYAETLPLFFGKTAEAPPIFTSKRFSHSKIVFGPPTDLLTFNLTSYIMLLQLVLIQTTYT